jgi:hypothetical protein
MSNTTLQINITNLIKDKIIPHHFWTSAKLLDQAHRTATSKDARWLQRPRYASNSMKSSTSSLSAGLDGAASPPLS